MALPEIPKNYATNAITQISRPSIADSLAYKDNSGDLYYHMDALGFPQYLIQDICVHMFGRRAMFLPTAFEDIYNRMKPISNYIGRRNIGREINPNYVVKDTVTGNGTGLTEVQITIALEGGTGGRWLSVGHEIVNQGRRNFIVTAETLSAGFQNVTLKPADGKYDLSVVGTTSVEFPDESLLGSLGVAKSRNAQTFYQTYTGFDQFVSYKMSRKFMEFQRRRDFLQNALATGAVYPFKLKSESGEDIRTFITVEEMKELVRFFNAVNASLLYSQENLNPELPILLGSGLKSMVLPEFRRPYSPSEVSTKWFNELLFEYRINNPYTEEITMIMGDALWDQLMYNLDRDFRPVRYTEPNRSDKELETPFVAGPNRYDRFIDVFGMKVRFMRLAALNQPSISGLRSPRNPNIGITAHDYFLVDMSPIHNLNLQTGAAEAEQDFKINFYCAQNSVDGSADSLLDVYKPGLVDGQGVTISNGPVVSFDDFSTRRLEMSYALELADQYSVIYGYLG